MSIDVTDATFETEVLGALRQGPRRRRPVGAVVRPVQDARADPREGRGRDRRARSSSSRSTWTRTPRRQLRSGCSRIPAVYAVRDHQVVNGFIGAQGESAVRQFVRGAVAVGNRDRRSPNSSLSATRRRCAARSSSTRATSRRWSRSLSCSWRRESPTKRSALLERIPETAETRRVAALARVGDELSGGGSSRRGGHGQARRACSIR